MSESRSRSRWILHRRVGAALLWSLLLAVIAIGINAIGIGIVGSVEGWRQWLADHAGHFLIWRLMLYGATTWGWIWMRRRLLAREPSATARHRLLRAEVAAVLSIIVLEVSQVALPE